LSITERLKTIVQEKMAELEGTVHSFAHVLRVLKVASYLAEKEGADVEVVQVGALLHDVGWSIGKPHHETGAELADKILKEMNYSKAITKAAVNIVLHHHLDSRHKLGTLEEKVVWDADKIDMLGILGIVRAFHLLGKESFDLVVKRAYKELKAIYPLLNTKSAKKVAEKRYRETVDLLNTLEKELSLSDLQIFKKL